MTSVIARMRLTDIQIEGRLWIQLTAFVATI